MLETPQEIVSLIEGGIRPVSAREARRLTNQGTPQEKRQRHRRARVLSTIGVVAVAAAVLALLLIPMGTPGGPSPAAAAEELQLLAMRAANVNVASLSPRQFIYSDIERQTASSGVTFTPGGPSVEEDLYGTQQTWVNAQGYGRMVVTTDPTPHFHSKADKAAWKAAGSPPALILPNEKSQVVNVTPTWAGGLASSPLFQATGLPTDPTALKRVLAAGQFKDDLFFNTLCVSTDCTVVASATALLEGPDIGATSALRSALFEILSHVAGVTDLGTVTNMHGESGIGLSYVQHIEARTGTAVCSAGTTSGNPNDSLSIHFEVPAHSVTYKFVVDPETTSVIGTDEITSLDAQSEFPIPCPGFKPPSHQTRIPPQWTSVLSEGVVASETSTSTIVGPDTGA